MNLEEYILELEKELSELVLKTMMLYQERHFIDYHQSSGECRIIRKVIIDLKQLIASSDRSALKGEVCIERGGTGQVAGKELELTSEHDCVLFNKKYKLNYLDLIIKTAVYTGVKEIEISNGTHETSGTIFTVGDFTILLMPRYRG